VTIHQVAVRAAAAMGIALIIAALGLAITNGRFFLFPFLLILGFPLAALFVRRPPSPPPNPPQNPPRISLN
jgi:hypothetical protein